jgi:hypothetical protein
MPGWVSISEFMNRRSFNADRPIIAGVALSPYYDPVKGQLIALEPEENIEWRKKLDVVVGGAMVLSGLVLLLVASEDIDGILIGVALLGVGGGFIAWASRLGPIAIYAAGVELNGLTGPVFVTWDDIDYYLEGKGRYSLRLYYHPRARFDPDHGDLRTIDIPDSIPDFQRMASYIKAKVDSNPGRTRTRVFVGPVMLRYKVR